MTKAILFPFVATTIALSSCATMGKLGKNSVALVQKTVDKIHPPAIPIVEVREKDLKKLPTGEERALAFENSRDRTSRHSFWSSFMSGPVDFKEPSLPENGGEMDGSLLPPKTP